MRRLAPFAGLLATLVLAAACPPTRAAAQAADSADSGLKSFLALEPIDAHTHILRNDPAFSAMLERLHLHVLDILVVDVKEDSAHRLFAAERQAAWEFISANTGRASLSTNFDPFLWSDAAFPRPAIADLNRDFSRGAVAATTWINPGMSLKDAAGKPVFPDDPKFQAIYKDIARHNKTFVAHLSGADEAWRPDNSSDPSSMPPVLTARDHIVQQNPGLRVIAAHLGGEKLSLEQIEHLLDQNPRLAVDTSGRIDFLLQMPRDQAVAFISKYQDRILYGSDLGFREPDGTVDQVTKKWESRYATDWRLLASGDTFEYKGKQVQGLHLPPAILRRLFHDNAVHWLPGIAH